MIHASAAYSEILGFKPWSGDSEAWLSRSGGREYEGILSPIKHVTGDYLKLGHNGYLFRSSFLFTYHSTRNSSR